MYVRRLVRYFLVLAVSDLLLCVSFIPISTSINGCTFTSEAEAHYFAHVAWNMISFWQTMATYTIMWLAMDRFLGVWMPLTYRRIHSRKNFMRIRIRVTALVCFVIHIVLFINGTVVEAKPPACDTGISKTAFHVFSNKKGNWFVRYWYKNLYLFISFWFPGICLIILNAGLVTAVMKGRLHFPEMNCDSATTPSSTPVDNGEINSRDKALIVTMISMSISYMIFLIPNTIFLALKSGSFDDRCCKYYQEEVVRDAFNLLIPFEHVVHIFFLLILNSNFRKELKHILHLEQIKSEENQNERRVTETAMLENKV